jgi:hypothetical protein
MSIVICGSHKGHPSQMAERGNGILFAGRDGPLEAGEQIGQSAQTAGRMNDGACE